MQRSTTLAADAAAVWARAVTPAGVNDELRPIARMTVPRAWRGASIADLPVGVPAGRSWILLGGLLPVDYDDLTIAEVGPGHRFLEESQLLSARRWRHERTVEPSQGGCVVTDRLALELRPALARVPGSQALARAIVTRLFRHRHRRLVRRWGAVAAARR